ncbi:hypothetical protein [Alicyclobacillus sp. SO9]|uniref:hypothetical protein n=1 Tax=Alicyclobacillus sp. SO9 TaxID=2665646 RepID=UPI0018E801BB|nr:hypothetical protein [Alicyclobacillus sp. SO9]QQE80907.1 hypothetical protein GI364_11280 [Alicyclobacillus sp. SO9]
MKMQYFGDGRIAFESMIQEYAAEQDMSFKDVLKWLSERPALSVAGELLGLPDINEESLNQLGEFLDSKGYMIPKMFGAGEKNQGLPVHHDKPTEKPRREKAKQQDKVKKPRVSLNLTKEQYLEKRLSGMKRTEIAKAQGTTPPTLYKSLREWGIKDPVLEEAAMEELIICKQPKAVHVQMTETRGEQPVDKSIETVDNVVEDGYVTLRIPAEEVPLPGVINTDVLDRADLLRVAFTIVQASVAWAKRDLLERLGDGDIDGHIQRYVDRQWAEFEKKAVQR